VTCPLGAGAAEVTRSGVCGPRPEAWRIERAAPRWLVFFEAVKELVEDRGHVGGHVAAKLGIRAAAVGRDLRVDGLDRGRDHHVERGSYALRY
jgi:hypothetical protein